MWRERLGAGSDLLTQLVISRVVIRVLSLVPQWVFYYSSGLLFLSLLMLPKVNELLIPEVLIANSGPMLPFNQQLLNFKHFLEWNIWLQKHESQMMGIIGNSAVCYQHFLSFLCLSSLKSHSQQGCQKTWTWLSWRGWWHKLPPAAPNFKVVHIMSDFVTSGLST